MCNDYFGCFDLFVEEGIEKERGKNKKQNSIIKIMNYFKKYHYT